MKTKLMHQAEKLLIFFLTFVYWLRNSFSREAGNGHAGEKNILIITRENGIGDIICLLGAFKALQELYPAEKGYNIFFASEESACGFLARIGWGQSLQLLPVRLKNRASCRDYAYSHKQLSQFAWEQIFSLGPLANYDRLLLLGLKARRYNVLWGGIERRGRLGRFLESLLRPVSGIELKYDTMLFAVYEKALSFFARRQVELELPYIEPLPAANPIQIEGNKYCVISIGIASNHVNSFRAWPIERFVAVAEFICRELSLDMVLCGDKGQLEVTGEFLSRLPEDCLPRIHDLVGRTSFEEWVEVTRGAEFVFGNDSGYIHLAAAVRTKAFFIMGYHNYGRFFPYELPSGKVPDDYQMPVPISAERPICTFCNSFWLLEDSSEKLAAKALCDRCVQEKGLYSCIDGIEAGQVIEVVKSYMAGR